MSTFFRRLFYTTTPAMSEAAKQKAQKLIDENAVMVFSKSYCPYCTATKTKLKGMGAKYNVLELDQIDDGSAIQDALEKITGQRSVPNIFIGQKHIGGNSDFQALDNSESLIKAAGAL
ncbi:hypothetical protein MCOR25_005320 [Pyricularia grisea]|uniref:Glutaredoxin domain-containing protein n=1 Tax=Pyricularia grisea TaxID=148305 RepID=A0A6P8B413_PYRGI|nr:hypothetical protein PgNI_06610 [Pyricularia grisea]KAI6365546.1 hypothetical protein MCOR25_005320 [Pyricularia grisea]TLD10047.1 hypothetical protein PgNI_06610 [Pyricularia grisea]